MSQMSDLTPAFPPVSGRRFRGDFGTPDELREQERLLRVALIEELGRHPLIVCGYSGRDRSIMEALRNAYARPGAPWPISSPTPANMGATPSMSRR
jgi:hypothetical protein